MDYNIRALTKSKNVIELVSIDEVEVVAKLDQPLMVSYTSPKGDYVRDNILAYYVLLNTWGHQLTEVSKEGWVSMYQRIVKVGLIPIIRQCNALSDLIIHGDIIDFTYTYGFLGPIIAHSRDESQLLQLLRYPKRFSPLFATRVAEDSLKGFISFNTLVKVENTKDWNFYILRQVRHILADMLAGYTFNEADGYFSTGTPSDARRPLLSKLRMYRKSHSCLSHCPMYGIGKSEVLAGKWRGTKKNRGFVKIVAVPKSFKAARIIAEEPASDQFSLQAIARSMRQAVERNGYLRYVNVEDQTRNQQYAYEGSIDGSYATIDFSSASDSICEALAVALLPQDIVSDVLSHKQAYMKYVDTWSKAGMPMEASRVVQMWATSGNAITFISESTILCAFALYSTQVVEVLIQQKLKDPSVFGDDVAIDDRAAEFFIDTVSLFGFIVNKDKTFFGQTSAGWYRESCGVEYLNSLPMHSRYYPRKPISLTPTGLSSLVDLEKRMFDDWTCRLFLREVILRLEPRMTSHCVGTDCADMWDTMDTTPTFHIKGGLDNAVIECAHSERRRYLSLSATYGRSELSSSDQDLLDMWYYHCYLLFGPMYSDPLMRLLRVSTSRKQYDRDSLEPTLSWRYTID